VVNKVDPQLSKPLEDSTLDVQGFESPRSLMDRVDEDLVPLLDLAHRPVISSRQFNRQQEEARKLHLTDVDDRGPLNLGQRIA
jgi:hypothetical protein